jgi:hypothetical protein
LKYNTLGGESEGEAGDEEGEGEWEWGISNCRVQITDCRMAEGSQRSKLKRQNRKRSQKAEARKQNEAELQTPKYPNPNCQASVNIQAPIANQGSNPNFQVVLLRSLRQEEIADRR